MGREALAVRHEIDERQQHLSARPATIHNGEVTSRGVV